MQHHEVLVLVFVFATIGQVLGQIRGVNIGGWLVTEQWITPSLFNGVADDEWSLCNELGKKRCLSHLGDHWDSFFTRGDFEDIKAAGLNAVRIPIGYWAVDVLPNEPYVSGQYPYLLRAVQWALELNLSVLVDLHGAPGSQNGQDNSGLIGPVLFPSNSSNAERSLRVLQNLTEEFSRDIYGGVVTGIELLNEPRLSDSRFPMTQLQDFYINGSHVVGDGSDTMNIVIHDAFWGPQYWNDYVTSNSNASQGSSEIQVDTHQYYAFEPHNNLPHATILESVCNISQLLKSNPANVPMTMVAEWSLETGHAPDASTHTHDNNDDQARRTWFRLLFEAQHAAYSPNGPNQASLGWYFWTWKTEYDIDTWSYRYGVARRYIPSDISNASQLVFPVLDNGCVDASYNYTAPKSVSAATSLRGDRRWLSACSATAFSILYAVLP